MDDPFADHFAVLPNPPKLEMPKTGLSPVESVSMPEYVLSCCVRSIEI